MRIENLKEGMRFKSYKELCIILGEKVKNGDSKISQLKEWNQYFEYRRDGNAFIITKIYDNPLQKVDGRNIGNNVIYADDLEILILDLLSQDVNNGKVCMSTCLLFQQLAMVNSNYSKGKQNILNLAETINVSEEIVYEFYEHSYDNLKTALETALKRLRSKALVDWSCTTIINITENNKTYKREATEAEKKLILHTENIILNNMDYPDKKHVVISRKWNDFIDSVNEILFKKYSIHFYYNAYKLLFNCEHIDYAKKKLQLKANDRLQLKTKLNSKVINQLENNSNKRHLKAIDKKEKFLSKMSEDIKELINMEFYSEKDFTDKILNKNERLRIEDNYLKDNKKVIDTCINENK